METREKNQIVKFEKKLCLLMRTGSQIWVEESTGEKLRDMLTGNEAPPRFIKIKELNDRLINTADLSEVLSPQDIDDRQRIAEGEWKCERGNWHHKKQRCDCYTKQQNKYFAEKKAREEAEENKPLSPEEQKRVQKKMQEIREHMGYNKSAGKAITNKLHGKLKNCVICGAELEGHLRRVCGGSCWQEDKKKHPEEYQD
jgi:hypothetical protein